MKYFENFDLVPYTFDPDRINFFNVKDIFARVKMLDSIIDNIDVYYNYDMKDSDTVESIAYKYYGDVNKFWIILFANKITDPQFELPLRQEAFNEFIINKYGSIANASQIIDHYEKKTTTTQSSANGFYATSVATAYYANNTLSIDNIVSLPNLNSVVTLQSPMDATIDTINIHTDIILYSVSAYDMEVSNNESKRSLKLIKKEFASQIENELKNLLAR